jgi:hypothetical protein
MRVLLQDTSSGSAHLTDEQITWFLTLKPNLYLAASAACAAIAASEQGISSQTVGDLSITYGSGASSYKELSRQYRLEGLRSIKPYAGGISIADASAAAADTDWKQPVSWLGIHDNEGDTNEVST